MCSNDRFRRIGQLLLLLVPPVFTVLSSDISTQFHCLLLSSYRALSENGSLFLPLCMAGIFIVFHAGKSSAQICSSNYRQLTHAFLVLPVLLCLRHFHSVSISFSPFWLLQSPIRKWSLLLSYYSSEQMIVNIPWTVHHSLSMSRLTNCTLIGYSINMTVKFMKMSNLLLYYCVSCDEFC